MRAKSSEKKFLLLVAIFVSQRNPDFCQRIRARAPTYRCCMFYSSEEAKMSRGACSTRRSSQEQPICFNHSQALHPAEEEEGEPSSTAGSLQNSGLDGEVTGAEGTSGC